MPVSGITEKLQSISANSMASQVVPVPTVSKGTIIAAILSNPLVIIGILGIIIGIIFVVVKIINKNK